MLREGLTTGASSNTMLVMTNLPVNANPSTTEPLPSEWTARQREVLEKAFELVQERGLANLTMKKVAERIGFTEAALYRHYPSKQALVFGLLDLLQSQLLPEIRAIGAQKQLPPLERLEQMVRHHIGVLRRTAGMPILFLAEGVAMGDGELLARMGKVMGEYREHLLATLRELDRPGLPPAEMRAQLILGYPAAFAITTRAFPGMVLPEVATDELVRYFVRALCQVVPGSFGAPGPKEEG